MTTEQENTQESTPSPQYATTDQIDSLQREIRGLQGLIDKGLNSIRADAEKRLAEEEQQRALNEIPEEYREFVAPLVKQVGQLQQQVSSLRSTGEAPQQEGDDLDTYLSYMGLNRNSPGVDVDAYYRGDNQAFIASATRAAVMAAQGSAETSQPAPQTRTSQPPPVDGTPSGNTSGQTWQEIYDLYIGGRISQSEFNERMAGINTTGL